MAHSGAGRPGRYEVVTPLRNESLTPFKTANNLNIANFLD